MSDKIYVIVMDVDFYEGWIIEGYIWWEVGMFYIIEDENVCVVYLDWEFICEK